MLEFASSYDVSTAAIGFNGPAVYADGACAVGPLYHITPDTFDLATRMHEIVPGLAGFSLLGLNDAETAAYAATRPPILDREPAPGETVLYINQGTGIGGDAICDGRSMRMNGQLAEYGEVLLRQPDGTPATWGSLVSGEGIAERYGTGCCAATLYDDPSTTATWEKVGEDMAWGLAALLPTIGPSQVVIGGSVSRCHPRYHAAMERQLRHILFGCLSSDSATQIPAISYVPERYLCTIALQGAYSALQSRAHQLVTVGQTAR